MIVPPMCRRHDAEMDCLSPDVPFAALINSLDALICEEKNLSTRIVEHNTSERQLNWVTFNSAAD